MTFRTRLVFVAAIAVVVAVMGASIASYLAARNSLIGSIDGTLQSTTQNLLNHEGTNAQSGFDFQYVSPSGQVLGGGPELGGVALPVGSSVKSVASGGSGTYFANITISGATYREFVDYDPSVAVATASRGFYRTPAALQVILPLSGVDSQLAHLSLALFLVAFFGVIVALLLAWIVGRAAIVPLDTLASCVEGIADTIDVTERLDPGGPDELGRLRRAFNRLLAALERSRDAQRQLVLDASHELRTPLTSLRTNLEVIQRLDELSQKDRSILVADVVTQLGELTTLVSDLAELARGERAESPPQKLSFDQLVEDAVEVAQTHGRPRDIHISYTCEPNWINGRADRILRAVGNLIDNALKWSPQGSQIEVDCQSGWVTVRDHGPGIPQSDLPHIFDRFYRAPTARGLPGSGLGLAIVAQVAESEGGKVTVAPGEHGGTIFWLGFPPVAPFGHSDRSHKSANPTSLSQTLGESSKDTQQHNHVPGDISDPSTDLLDKRDGVVWTTSQLPKA